MNVTARQRFWPLKNWFRVERNALDNLEDAGKRIEQAIEKRDASKLKNAITAYGAALNQADRHHGHLRPLEQEAWKRARFFFDDASTFYIDKLVPSLLFKAGQADVDFEAIARMLRHTVERHGDPTEELGNALDAMAENKSLEHESSFGRFKILDNAGLPMQSTETLDTKTLFQALKQVDALFKRRKLDYLLGGVLYLEHSPGRRHGAAYMRRSDRIEINTDATAWAKSLTRNLVHELGHRIWFRFLTSAQRDRFSSQWIEKGEDEEEPGTRLPSVTPYGTTNRHEDFAETFTEVVMGTQKDRRLAERLQSVLPKGRVLSSVTADVKAMNDFVASLNKALPPIEQAAKRVETLLYEWQGTGKVNMRQLKLALTAHAKQVAKLGELKLPSNLRPGEREVLQDKLNSLALFYVQNVADETAKLKKQLAKMEPKKAASAWQYRIGDVAKMVREMSIPGLVDAAGRLVEPELRFGGFTILDNHGIREVRARYWFEIIARASKLLKQKGLDYLLYGKLLLEPVEGWNGLYHSRGDYITLDTGERGRPNDHMLYTFVHELGHRLWFKFLDGGARDKFAGEWVDQAADIDELYRKMASMMKISKQEAEEGWRVLSDGWDMRTFRKWVKSDNVRKLRWFLALKRVYALSVSETERFVTDDGVTNKRAFDLTREHFERLKARTVSRDASIGEGEEGIRRAQEQAQERHDKDMQSMHDDVMRGIENIQFNKYVLRNLLEPDRSDVKTPLPRGMYRKAFDFLPSVRPSITKYGQTNRMEDFAEVFAQTILGINKDRAVQERLQSVLPKGRVLSNVTTAAFNRSAAFAVFKHAVKQLWGAQSSESKDLQDAKNRMVARLTLKLSNDEPKGGVMASLAYDPRTVRTIGDLLVSAAPAYLLRISDRLLEQSADVVKGIMFHEALHVGYPKHDKAFRDMAAQHKIPLTESWTEEPGWKVQRKDGSRYKTLRTFETEEKAREWAMDELKRTPGKYRLSASVLSTEPTHTPIDAIARAAARALDATYDVTGTTIEFEWSPAADPKHPTHRRTTPRLPRGRVIEFAGDPSRNQQYGPHRWTLLTKLPDIASDKRLLEIAMDEFDLDERDALDYINPSDIVETAGAWDSQVFVSRVWEELMAAGYATQDGAVVIDPPSVKLEYDYDGKELYRLVANVRLESDGTRYMWNGTFADARGRKVATVDGRADAARAERTFIAHMQAALKQAEKKIAPRKYRAVGESLPLSQSAAKGAVAIEAERELLYHGTRGPLARAIMDKGLRQDSGFSNFGGQGGVLADAPAMPFKVGDLVRHGKYKNKIAKIVRFGTNDKGQTTVLLEPVPKGRKKTKELGLFKIWTTPDAIEAVASKYKVRTVKQLVREGYTEKQAELIHRNLTDKADTDSWTARKVARDAAKYPRLSDRISDPTVTVYRVVPRGVKNVEVGDYVFRTKQQAESFRDEYGFIRGQPNIITLVAPASHFILPHRDDDELLYVGDIGMGVANATSFDKVLSPATTKRLRADFLLLMKNVKRLHNYKQTLEWNDAVNRWAIRLERYIESASAELGRFRRDEISPDLIKVWQQYLRAALWPLLVEIRATGFDRYEMATRYTYRQHNRLDVERRLFDDFAKQAPKFDARVKRVARESWKRFDQILETMQKSFGERGMKGLPIPQDERIDIEGFSVTLKNLSERGHYKPKDAVDNVRRALAYYRKRAAKTYPWLVRYRLPIILDGEISLEKLAHYDPADKTIWLKASALKPERLAHVIAHEMGHHVWHERLSANDKAYWAAAIKGSRGPLDLRDAIKLGSFAALDKKLMQTDPVMALRLQTFMHDPRFARYDMATVEGIERYLSEGNDPVIQVTTEPITGYASKNDAEAFCEALGLLVGYGPRAVLPIVRERMRMLLPQLKVQASVTAAAKSGAYWLFNNGKLVELDDTHADYVEQNPKPFGLTAEEVEYQGDYLDFTLWPKEVATKLFKKAMRIANSPHSVSFITASPLTARHIKQAQDVLSKLGVNLYRVQIVMGPWDGSTYRVPGNDFMFLKSPRDLKLASAAVVAAADPALEAEEKLKHLKRFARGAATDELYHTTSLHGLAKILQSRTFLGGRHGGFVSFSEKPVFGDIQANDAVLVLDRTKLRNRVMPVEYDEAWYDRHPEHAAYVAGEGWREQYVEPEDCYDDEGWADENCVEQAYRDAELMSFLYKKEERDWVARSSGDLRLPAEAFKRVVVPKQKLAAAEALLKKLGLRMPVKVLRGKSKATAMVPRGTLRQTTAKDEVDPDQYRKERGRCPRGYGFDGEKCIKTPPKKGRDGPSDDVEDPPKGRGKGEDEKPAETALDDAKHAVEKVKKKLAKPQGPQAEVTKQNPYGLDDETRGAKTAADLGGHEGLRKVLGHLEPSKLPPPDVDPSSIRVNLDGDNDSKAMMTWRDGKGRLQAAYTPKFLNRNAAVKWERVKKLEAKADKAIESFGNRMQDGKLSTRERDAAAIMTIIGKTGLRPGSTSGLKSTGHRGISTLSADNVKVEGGSVSLEFVGKSGKTNRTKIDDPALASYLTDRLKGKAGDELLFDAREKDLPATMEAGGVKGFKPKDFRTRIAGKIAAKTMAELADPPPPMPSNRTKAKKLIEQRIKEASSAVADQLNNTPAMAKKAYINPAIFQTWAESVGASEYAAAAAMARKPTAADLWKGALGVKLPGADEQVDVHPELEDDDQLDSVPEPEINSTVEGAVVERIVGPLLEAGHRDLARAFVSRFDA